MTKIINDVRLNIKLKLFLVKTPIIKIEKIVFVNVDEQGKPKPHGKSLANLTFNTSQ